MPDKFGRPYSRERRSGGLLRLSYFMDQRPDTVVNPKGLALSIRVARMAGNTDEQIGEVLEWTVKEIDEFMEVHNEPF